MAHERDRLRKYYAAHKAQVRMRLDAYRERHPELVKKWHDAWLKLNRKHINRLERARRRRERKINATVLRELPCMECGDSHGEARREAILRRMLPASAHEIREAHPCLWGDASEAHSAGERMLYRDLRRAGAMRDGSTWYPATEMVRRSA